ncbi:MAG: hypothetical protein AVDCRST_MAG88-3504, partial [uncultured Thermomicrobiales bacterium]
VRTGPAVQPGAGLRRAGGGTGRSDRADHAPARGLRLADTVERRDERGIHLPHLLADDRADRRLRPFGRRMARARHHVPASDGGPDHRGLSNPQHADDRPGGGGAPAGPADRGAGARSVGL